MKIENNLIEKGLLPGAEQHHVGLIPCSERAEEVFVTVAAYLDGIGDHQGGLLFGQRTHILPAQLDLWRQTRPNNQMAANGHQRFIT